MSSSSPSTDAPQAAPPPPSGTVELALLRAELDRLDDALHDILLARADIVARVGASTGKGVVKLRLGRQAAILRRLLARHHGPYPASAVPRLWLELLAGSTAMQGPFAIAVAQGHATQASPGGRSMGGRGAGGMAGLGSEECHDPPLLACAREQFGALTRMRLHRSPVQAMAEVRAGAATVAVLPLPAEGEPAAAAWWTILLAEAARRETPGTRLHVVARLPLWAPRPEGAPLVPALVVAAVPPDPSGADRTLLGLEFPVETSRARLSAAFAAAGLLPRFLLLRRDPDHAAARALVEVEGFVTSEDPRLPQVLAGAFASPGSSAGTGPGRPSSHPLVLGAYAVPLAEPPAPGAAP